MKKVISYNFDQKIDLGTDWSLFFKTRRDSNFAAVFEIQDNEFLVIRDHLGIVPVYFRVSHDKTIWSFSYNELLESGDMPTKETVRHYIAFMTAKVTELIPEVRLIPPGTVAKVKNGEIKILYTYKMEISPINVSRDEAKNTLEKILDKAVERTLKHDSVGLYLSGGMDSGLLGLLLKKKGVKIIGYTALPWGRGGTEYEYALKNAEIIGCHEHYFRDVDPKKYDDYLSKVSSLYKTPNGTATTLNIASLWTETNIRNESQLYFAQNTDTFTSSVPAQVNAIIMQKIPTALRKFIVDMPFDKVIQNYLYHSSRGRIWTHSNEEYVQKSADSVTKIAQAGMYIAHTPSDSEAINSPSIASDQLCSNPYYDIDLIEYYLSLPVKYKMDINKKQKTLLSFEKKLFREIAVNYLPADLVYRKKGFVLPKERNELSKVFFNNLPNEQFGVKVKNNYDKLSLEILRRSFR